MVSEYLKSLFESRSYWDLLLIWTAYSSCWMAYIILGHFFNSSSRSIVWRIENGVFLGAFCLLIKGYLPPLLFQITIILSFAFVFRASGIKWLRSMLTAASIDVLILLSDIIFIQPIIMYMPGGARFIVKTSVGIAAGTFLESIFPIITIFIWRKVGRRWSKTKFKKNSLK